jgi:hypothetical protein
MQCYGHEGQARVVVEKDEEETYTVHKPHQHAATFRVKKEEVELIGGKIPLNVCTFKDAANVFSDLAVVYSNDADCEEIANIAGHHRRRIENCLCRQISSDGITHHNTHARSEYGEVQRRQLEREGCVIKRIEVQHRGRKCVAHKVVMRRNEIIKTLDHIGYCKDGGQNGVRNANSMKPIFKKFDGYSTAKTTIYSHLLNPKMQPRDEESSIALHEKVESARGTNTWGSLSKELGTKFMLLAAKVRIE